MLQFSSFPVLILPFRSFLDQVSFQQSPEKPFPFLLFCRDRSTGTLSIEGLSPLQVIVFPYPELALLDCLLGQKLSQH